MLACCCSEKLASSHVQGMEGQCQIEIKDVKVPSFLVKCIPPKGPRKLVGFENLNYMRNNLQHKGSTTLDKEEFEKYWNDTKGILKRH